MSGLAPPTDEPDGASDRHVAGGARDLLEHEVDDDDLSVSALPGVSGRMVVSFTGIGHGMGGIQRRELVAVGSQGGDNLVAFVIDKRRSWFALPGMHDRILAAIGRIVDRHRPTEVVTIGNSMGGYGAAVFAERLGAKVAVAFSPQFTLRPARIEERRWQAWTNDLALDDFPDADRFLSGRTRLHAVFGTGYGPDRPHAEGYATSAGTRVWMGPGDHQVARLMKTAGFLGRFVAALTAGNEVRADRIMAKTAAWHDATALAGSNAAGGAS